MSGGSWDYVYLHIENAAHDLMRDRKSRERRAFGELLLKCAKAMHAIEWVDSADKSEGDELAAIMECISQSDVLDVCIKDAKLLLKDLESAIKDVETSCPPRPR